MKYEKKKKILLDESFCQKVLRTAKAAWITLTPEKEDLYKASHHH